MSEKVEIILLEHDRFVSLASCGLLYSVDDVITSERNLIIVTPEHEYTNTLALSNVLFNNNVAQFGRGV